MFAFQICMAGIIATGGGLVILTSYRNYVVYSVIACLCLSYTYFLLVRKKNMKLNSAEKALLLFTIIGLLHVILSYLEVNREFPKLDLYFDKSFIPRQASYYLVLPAIFLFQDKYYTRAKEYLISHYGEILFWCLYAFELYYMGKVMAVSANLLLGWLALKIKSTKWWRNWVRYAAVLLTPLTFDGTSTMLIFRVVFVLIIFTQSGWSRLALRWMAIGLMIVLIVVSFIAPVVIKDTSFISDYNAKWRLNYWTDEIQNLKNTYGLGVGYGTSYPSKAYAQKEDASFSAKDGYSQKERTFVLSCHNSFVSVAMRTGIFGITALFLFVFLMLWEMLKHRVLASKATFFALLGAVVLIAFNVGLESPSYLFSFVFCLGECNQEVWRIRRESTIIAAEG